MALKKARGDPAFALQSPMPTVRFFCLAAIAAAQMRPLLKAAMFTDGADGFARVALPRTYEKEQRLLAAVDRIAACAARRAANPISQLTGHPQFVWQRGSVRTLSSSVLALPQVARLRVFSLTVAPRQFDCIVYGVDLAAQGRERRLASTCAFGAKAIRNPGRYLLEPVCPTQPNRLNLFG